MTCCRAWRQYGRKFSRSPTAKVSLGRAALCAKKMLQPSVIRAGIAQALFKRVCRAGSTSQCERFMDQLANTGLSS